MKKFLTDTFLLITSAILFAFSQPNMLVLEGLPFLAYFALFPMFIVVRNVRFRVVWLYGILYGALSYGFLVYWLIDFHPVIGLPIIVGLYGFQYMILFLVLKVGFTVCGKFGWIVQWIIWCAYEYIKTTGFAGFSYGNTAYSHWQMLPLIQIVDLVGIWGLCALITFPSAWLSVVIPTVLKNKQEWKIVLKREFFAHKISAFIWIGLFVFSLTYGLIVQKDYSTYEQKKIALIQANTDPWQGGTVAYTRDYAILERLTNEALAENPDVDMVVWSETAFIPSIKMHYKFRENRLRFDLVKELLTFIESKNVPFVIGNPNTVRNYTDNTHYEVEDYNAVYLFKPGENVIPPEPYIYNKMHLVPFTESFPYEKQLPWLYDILMENDTHLWNMGTEASVFTVDNLTFGTPICFEDTFGYVGRRFVNNGAQAFVNVTNDSWAHDPVCQYQHLAMATFRSVENRVPTVRATASGQTAVIDPNGKITVMAPNFEETFLIGEVPVVKNASKTLFTLWGDWVAYIFIGLSVISLLIGFVQIVLKKNK